MMYRLLLLGLMAWPIVLHAQPRTVRLSVALDQRADAQVDSLVVMDAAGSESRELARAAIPATGRVELSVPVPQEGVYLLTLTGEEGQTHQIVLGDQPAVTLQARATDLAGSATFPNSPSNQQLRQLLDALQTEEDEPTEATEARRRTLATLTTQPTIVGLLARLYRIPDYAEDGRYRDQADYFVQAFFANDSLADPRMGYLYVLSSKAEQYATVLMQQLSLPADTLLPILNRVRQRTPAGSRARRLVLEGFVGAAASDADLLSHIAAWYLADVPPNQLHDVLATQLAKLQRLRVGQIAPDFRLPRYDSATGDSLSLSELRGKVVLVDFWASWCGPCRRENPNVVRMYNRFKDKGFTILGVSLDRDEDDWHEAIRADGLAWNHVSDLQFWQSAAAQLYNVQAIPATVLLDRDGRIVARDLRGEALEAKVAELLGPTKP